MLRVCGVTYDHTLNYGSSFQAYALQIAIESMSIHGEKCLYNLIPLFMLKDYRTKKYLSIEHLIWRVERLMFDTFEKKNMKYAKCKALSELSGLNNSYDAFVCGSDVIWRSDYNMQCPAYFLNFAKKYKFSYAASFGQTKESSIEQDPNQGEYLRELNSISCRDEFTQNRVSELTAGDKQACIVCDPVMLLEKLQWEEIAGKETNKKRPYIFSYCTSPFQVYDDYIEKISKEMKLPVVNVTAYTGKRNLFKYRQLLMKTPQTWLRLLSQADAVVTNSFHATVFCLLFHKKFLVVLNREKTSTMRLYDLLSKVKLTDHIYTDVPPKIEVPQTDFTCSDKYIADLRDYSFAFLRKNLEAAQRKRDSLSQNQA